MEENITQKAIDLALKCKWAEAIKANLMILKTNKEDLDSLNRLARAYFEIGNIKKAKSTSTKVLKIDPHNNISLNSLEKYKNCLTNNFRTNSQSNIDPSIFIEEMGKTKLVTLINLGSKKSISNLSCGDEVLLAIHSHRVTINTINGIYLGKIADDLSARLRTLVKAGNIYKVFVKSAKRDCVKVLIKEHKKGQGLENVISFAKDASEPIYKEFADPNL